MKRVVNSLLLMTGSMLAASGRLAQQPFDLGRAWSDATLIRLACAYEPATHHRHPPQLQ